VNFKILAPELLQEERVRLTGSGGKDEAVALKDAAIISGVLLRERRLDLLLTP
jgi:hypothetical protein